jgi:hypothetical protein
MQHNCIICISDDHYQIVGPFASRADLVAYGCKWQAENDDDPRWQSIYLADPNAPPIVVAP